MDVPASAADPAAWLRLARAPGLTPRRLNALLDELGTPGAVLAATDARLAAHGLGAAQRAALRHGDARRLAADLAWLRRERVALLTRFDPDYPPALAACADPPPLLFLRGCRELLAAPAVAIVGSRRPTPAGRAIARQFAAGLADAGLAVVSGLAAGIDGAAHAAALASGGMTVAVTGNGLDRVYPLGHRDLAGRLARSGLLLSEFPPGTPPLRENFPRRNRVISGLSLGVLVVEAAQRSGSLITARFALEQGREVFAVPGALGNPLARGCHALIRDGAKLVEEVADVLEELPPAVRPPAPAARAGAGAAGPPPPDADPLVRCLQGGPASVDALVEQTGRPAAEIAAALLALELDGHVSCDASGRYCLLPGSP